MKHSEFVIGGEFLCGENLWRCTDVGTRTICAISLAPRPAGRDWFKGPPYAVAEDIFDENDMPACEVVG